MNLLIIGSGKGSWQIRGEQIGEVLGARTAALPSEKDWSWATHVLLIKRGGMNATAMAHLRGLPIIWDALDFWSQPSENGLQADGAQQRLQATVNAMRPALIIGATQAMTTACARLSRSVYLPHHAWPTVQATAPRQAVRIVAYQGNPAYLGKWSAHLMASCAKRGWRFVVNPERLDAADILVALRDGVWDGWICRQWKSGVKLVNALAAGRPIITQPSAAAFEIAGPQTTIERVQDLEAALDFWTPERTRSAAFHDALEQAGCYTRLALADQYRQAFATMGESSCVA